MHAVEVAPQHAVAEHGIDLGRLVGEALVRAARVDAEGDRRARLRQPLEVFPEELVRVARHLVEVQGRAPRDGDRADAESGSRCDCATVGSGGSGG